MTTAPRTSRARQIANMLDVTSTVRGTAWPAIPGPFVSQLLAMQAQFESAQWLSPEELLARQSRQLGVLLAHAYETVPVYRQRFDEVGLHPSQIAGPEQWVQIPPCRAATSKPLAELLSTAVPAEHGPHSTLFTSGSTGKPVMIVGTAVTQLFWNACAARHLWHRRSPRASLAAIRSVTDGTADPPDGAMAASWGRPPMASSAPDRPTP